MGTRRELFTLLGVAAAVAVISTGLFYGLVVNKLEEGAQNSKPKTAAGRDSPDGLGIPNGMRAVSVHVMDAGGIVRLLRPGHRVDVQMVYSADGTPGGTGLRTVAQNLEVYRMEQGGEVARDRQSAPVVTLLARPAEADILGLADSAARIRLLLRRPGDREVTERNGVGLPALAGGEEGSKPRTNGRAR